MADELQWLALNRPHAIDVIRKLVQGLIRKFCVQPLAQLTLTDALEYTSVEVIDPTALLPLEEERLGRQMRDIAPGYAVEEFERCYRAVRHAGRAMSYVQVRPDGTRWTVAAMRPKPDQVIVNVVRAGTVPGY